MSTPDEHPVKRVNDGYYVCGTCGNSGSERWALRHQFPPGERAAILRAMTADAARDDAYATVNSFVQTRGEGGDNDQPDDAPVELAERIARVVRCERWHKTTHPCDDHCSRPPTDWDCSVAHAVIDELIDLAGTEKLLRGIREYRRPHA